jgi:hypothetical protein
MVSMDNYLTQRTAEPCNCMLLSVTPFVERMDEIKKNIFKVTIAQTPMDID